jgi:hypothetical protein
MTADGKIKTQNRPKTQAGKPYTKLILPQQQQVDDDEARAQWLAQRTPGISSGLAPLGCRHLHCPEMMLTAAGMPPR